MRVILEFSKHGAMRFISHLDLQRLVQRAFRRARLPLMYSQGFNPHPLISFATALSLGASSDGEFLDVMLSEQMQLGDIVNSVNSVLPPGMSIVSAIDATNKKASLTSLMRSAEYSVKLVFSSAISELDITNTINTLLGGEIIVLKKTKGGMKNVDIAPQLIALELKNHNLNECKLYIKGVLTASGGLPLDLLLNEMLRILSCDADIRINRTCIEMDWMELK